MQTLILGFISNLRSVHGDDHEKSGSVPGCQLSTLRESIGFCFLFNRADNP